ncbi:TetR/AcrR family transcriptional regulator [Nocardia sp. CA-120079]|uniref:TetR/AcrR family transcriptional regulator n=1 Tax=Nocardia sp. CA-120079 TaxID=3239974 RepID=UPI003D98A1F3
MTTSPPPAGREVPSQLRRRDSARTRQRLLDAARHRFARNGYAGTPVREVADEAGVNVALINRYFGSKEGLFAACLTEAIDGLRRATVDTPQHMLPSIIAMEVADPGHYEHLLLLVRSSGDERADEIRSAVLRDYGEALAARAGWQPDAPNGEDLLLRAQLILGTAIGMALLRSSGLRPLASVPEESLVTPLRDLVNAALPPISASPKQA